MATLAGKTVLVVGGSSGLGYSVAKASLLSRASRVIIPSSSPAKVDAALDRLKHETSVAGSIEGAVAGAVVDAKDSKSVRAFMGRVGEIDHLVWTAGDVRVLNFPDVDADASKDMFDVRFWGAFTAAQVAKIRPGGSITFTIGQNFLRPRKGWSLATAIHGAVDSLTRGLAVGLAPVRVNVVSSGFVKTEFPEDLDKKLLVPFIGHPDEIAEAYIFCMKCTYITGQRIEVDGGLKYI